MRPRRSEWAASLVLLLLVPLAVVAAEPAAEDLVLEAALLMSEEKIEKAIGKLLKATEIDPENSVAWGNLGIAYDRSGEHEEAIDSYKEVLRLGDLVPIAKYNIACSYAQMDDADQAFHWLEEVLKDGFRSPERLRSDSDLDNIRDDPRFEGVLVAAGAHPKPCLKDERYRALDFWIGRWNVKDADGRLVGQNFITPMLEGCMILENWIARGEDGGQGKSFNYFDPELGKWRQNWVGDRGYVIDYVGGPQEDGAMFLEGRNTLVDGTTELSRMKLTPNDDGTVTQFIEQSKDEGKTWYVWFRGTYEPMKDEPSPTDTSEEAPSQE